MRFFKVTEIPNGVYLIKNRQTGYYADIQGPTMANGTTIHQWKFHGGKSQKWTFTHVGDGYYSIKTTHSSASYYLGVINDSTTVDVDIVLRNGAVMDGMKWRVETTTDGAVKLVPKTGSTYALATTTSSATNGAKLIQGAYVNNTSYRDEWYLHQVKDFSLVCLGEGQDDPAMALLVANVLNDLRSGANQQGYSFRTIAKDEFFVQLATCEFFNVITHGGIPNGMELTSEWIYTSDFTMYNSSALSNLKFACVMVCNNGEGGENADNIVNAMYNKGAQCVIGFKKTLFALSANYWNEHLVTNLTMGYSISQSIANADLDLSNSSGTGVKYTILGDEDWDPNTDADTHPKYIVGDTSIILFP